MRWQMLSFIEGVQRIEKVAPAYAQLLASLASSVKADRPCFILARYAYAEPIVQAGKWVRGGLPIVDFQGEMPLGIVLHRHVEVSYHVDASPTTLPTPRANLLPSEWLGCFELLDSRMTDTFLPVSRPDYEAWNLTAGTTCFKYLSCRKLYRQKLTAMLPGLVPRELHHPVWTLALLRQKVLRETEQPAQIRTWQVPEWRYLQLLQEHFQPQTWFLEVLYFEPFLLQRLMGSPAFLIDIYHTAWRQSREKRTFADIALHFSPKLTLAMNRAGIGNSTNIFSILFDFVLLCHRALMGFRPVPPGQRLSDLDQQGPFEILEMEELTHSKRPILLVPSFVSTRYPVFQPIDLYRPRQSWKKDVFQPMVEVLASLLELQAVDPKRLTMCCVYIPRAGEVYIRQFGENQIELNWLQDLEMDRHGHLFLAAQEF